MKTTTSPVPKNDTRASGYTVHEQAIIAWTEAEERRMADLYMAGFHVACEAEDEGGWAL
jgi:hypothetical protein